MPQRILPVLLSVCFMLGAAACKKTPQEQTAAKIAAERADKKQKAIKNYQDLLKKYPNSEYADKARARLQEMGPAATTPGKK